MKKILCLGAGLVARPYVQYLSDNGFKMTVASRTLAKALILIEGCRNVEVVQLDIKEDDELLEELTESVDLVCSLLPYTYHVKAARVALRHKKHFCTTSYISPDMQSLDQEARNANVLLLQECGVDPGIDHMSAMKIIDRIHKNHGKILSFTSFTGGLPAPEDNDNPFGYKLSWSPRGVLLAGRNNAHFLQNGKEIKIDGNDLFDNCEIIDIPNLGPFEGYPNRDSMAYINIYSIPETKTMLRGTLRNIGWCRTLKKIAELGFLSIDDLDLEGQTYGDMLSHLLDADESNLRRAVAHSLNMEYDDEVIERLNWLGLFSSKMIPKGITTPLDALCNLFEEKLQYNPGERDMIVMHHEFVAEYPDGKKKISSTLIDYGIPNGDSSMSRTVALPVAIASRMILEGTINLVGVHRPILPEIYMPILEELESFGIVFEESIKDL